MPSLTETTAGSGTSNDSQPPAADSRRAVIRSPPGWSDLTPVTHGRSSAAATRMPTWKPPLSADSLPNRIRSNGPFSASSERIASTMADAVASGSQSRPSVWSSTARSIPIAIASRSWSSASTGPSVRTLDEPPPASTIRTASSTAHSSCGLIVNPRCRVSISSPSAVRKIRPPVAGTRLTQTRTFIRRSGADPGVLGIEQRRRAGNRDCYRIALAEVLHDQPLADLRSLRRQIRHEQVLADRRSGSGRRHIRAAPLRVDDPCAVRRENGLAPEHVALDPGRGGRIVDGQRAQDRGRLGGTPLLVCGAAHEIGVLERRPGHAGLHEVEVELELCAVRPVALLEPGRDGIRPDPDRHEPMRLPRPPERIPDPEPLLDRDVDLPAELADVA